MTFSCIRVHSKITLVWASSRGFLLSSAKFATILNTSSLAILFASSSLAEFADDELLSSAEPTPWASASDCSPSSTGFLLAGLLPPVVGRLLFTTFSKDLARSFLEDSTCFSNRSPCSFDFFTQSRALAKSPSRLYKSASFKYASCISECPAFSTPSSSPSCK